jgi:hypothetical protein
MKQVDEYRRYADICRKLSLDVNDAVSKRQLMEMAAVWTMLAIDREEQLGRVKQTGHFGLAGTDGGAVPGSE